MKNGRIPAFSGAVKTLALAGALTVALLSGGRAEAQFDSRFASSLAYIYQLEIKVEDPILGITLYETTLLDEDPQTTDIDLNGVVDFGHAELLDRMAATPGNPHYNDLVIAWNHNWNAVNNMLNNVDVTVLDLFLFELDYWDFVSRDRIQRAATGLVTLGEPAGIAALQLLEEEFGVPIDPTAFDLRMGPYLGVAGDADDDGICNRSEYVIYPANYAGYDQFVDAAMNPNARLGGGTCLGDKDYNDAEDPNASCEEISNGSYFDQEAIQLYNTQGWDWYTEDADGNGMLDSWEVGLASLVMCNPDNPYYIGARTRYTGNLWRLNNDLGGQAQFRGAMAAAGVTDNGLGDIFTDFYGNRNSLLPFSVDGIKILNASGDLDDDAFSNKAEYDRVFENGGNREQFLLAAAFPLSTTVDRCEGACDDGDCGGTPGGCIDFDTQMRDVDSALDPFREELGGYTFDPQTADINGGGSIEDEVIFPNGLLDSDEFAVISYLQAHPDIDLSADGGITAQQVISAYNQNLNQALADLGGSGGTIEIIAPSLKYILAAFFLIGDENSLLIPVTAMTEAANIGELELGVSPPNLNNYVSLPQFLSFEGDLDGDGYSNKDEYDCFRSRSRCCYLLAALDKETIPDEETCGGSGEEVEIEPNDGSEPSICPVTSSVDTEGFALYAALGYNWLKDDVDANGIADRWEALLAAQLACDVGYANNDRVRNKFTGNFSRVVHDPKLPDVYDWLSVLSALSTANGDLALMLMGELELSLSLQVLTIEQDAILSGGGDLDDDGFTNAEEAAWVEGLGVDYYRQVVLDATLFPGFTEDNFGELPDACPIEGVFDAQGQVLYSDSGWDWATADVDQSGIPDSWEVALLADVLCNQESPLYGEARTRFTANANRFRNDPATEARRDNEYVIVALMTVSPGLASIWRGLSEQLYWPGEIEGDYVFASDADLEGDGIVNLDEYRDVVENLGDVDDYVIAAQTEPEPPCGPEPCTVTCESSGIAAGFEADLTVLFGSIGLLAPEFDIPIEEADVDENGILDIAQARLLDAILADPSAPGHCCVRAAWDFNAQVSSGLGDQFVAHPLWGLLTNLLGGSSSEVRALLETAITGLMTIGEPNTQSLISDALGEIDLTPPLPTIDFNDFDGSAVAYIGREGDADTDGVCTIGEYDAIVSSPADIDAFVAAALDAQTVLDAGTCACGGFVAEGEGEGINEGDPGGEPTEGEGVEEAEGEVELPECAEPGLHAADYQSTFNVIDATEWARVRTLFLAGEYSWCPEGLTVDGYCPDLPGVQQKCPHNADYQEPSWSLDVQELTRIAQFHVAGGFAFDPLGGAADLFTVAGSLNRTPGNVTIEPLPESTGVYTPGQTLSLFVTLTVDSGDGTTVMGLEHEVPDGWQLLSWSGTNVPDFAGQAAGTGIVAFLWLDPSTSSVSLRVTYSVAADATDVQPVHTRGFARIDGPESSSPWRTTNFCQDGVTCPEGYVPEGEGEAEGEGVPFEGAIEGAGEGIVEGAGEGIPEAEGEGVFGGEGFPVEGAGEGEGNVDPCATDYHSADMNADNRVALDELLRVIQFFNVGGYGCGNEFTEDGYQAGRFGRRDCCPHDTDFKTDDGTDWEIDLAELLRLIQFYNAGGYRDCNGEVPESEDGFCVE